MPIEDMRFDIVVVGGGLAGVCAAIAAARECRLLQCAQGTVALVHDRPVLGGNASSEIRVMPHGAGHDHPWALETGIVHELMLEERVRNHIRWDSGATNSICDLVLWEAVRAEPDLTLFLNTSVRGVSMGKAATDGRPSLGAVHAVQFGTEREFDIAGRLFIDASGDGVVGAAAGADFRLGRESRREFGETFAPVEADAGCQGSSLLLQARDVGYPVPFTPPPYAADYPTEESLHGRPHGSFHHGFWWIEVGFPFETIRDNEDIRDELLRHVLGAWDHMKNHCPRFKEQASTWVLDWFGWLPGKRESRRIMGDHILTERDIQQGTVFPDRVAHGGRFIDLHTIGGILAKDQPGNPVDVDPELWERMDVRPYSIPLRSLYSRTIANLFMAGRDISATHVAHGSTRVMLTCAAIGQAVGTAAAHCIVQGRSPRDQTALGVTEVQQSLLRQGCYVPHLANADTADLARQATVLASSSGALTVQPELDAAGLPLVRSRRWALSVPRAVLFPISARCMRCAWLWLENDGDTAQRVRAGLRAAEDVWDFRSRHDLGSASAVVEAGYAGWVSFDFGADLDPHHLYWIYTDALADAGELVYWRYRVDPPIGVVSAWQRPTSGHWNYLQRKGRWGSPPEGYHGLCLQVEPPSLPYEPDSVLSGVTRPEAWPNAWVSDPEQGMPQWVELRWPHPVEFNHVELVFDTNLNRNPETTMPLTRRPECVRDYELHTLAASASPSFGNRSNGGERQVWLPLLRVDGNYQRRRVHSLDTVRTAALRLQIHATNGDQSARVYEIRVYNQRRTS